MDFHGAAIFDNGVYLFFGLQISYRNGGPRLAVGQGLGLRGNAQVMVISSAYRWSVRVEAPGRGRPHAIEVNPEQSRRHPADEE